MELLEKFNRNSRYGRKEWYPEYMQDIELDQYVGSITLIKKEVPVHVVEAKMYSYYAPMKHAEVAGYRQVDGLQIKPDIDIRNMTDRRNAQGKYQITEYNRETKETSVRYTDSVEEMKSLVETLKEYLAVDTRDNLNEDKKLPEYISSGMITMV